MQHVEYITLGKETRTQNVTVCQGCRKGFKDPKYFTPPTNLVFRYKMYRKCLNKDKEWVFNPEKPYGYFHAEDMYCIRNYKELCTLSIQDVYMTNVTFLCLDDVHFRELDKRQHLEHILNTQREFRK